MLWVGPGTQHSTTTGCPVAGPSASEESESDVDETVYRPPKDAALPVEMMALVQQEGQEGGEGDEAGGGASGTAVPTTAVGELLASWTLLRSFSWQLRLSPFTFDDFCLAMVAPKVGLPACLPPACLPSAAPACCWALPDAALLACLHGLPCSSLLAAACCCVLPKND